MIEVYSTEGGYAWKMIGFDKQTLAYDGEIYLTDLKAFAAAKAYRTLFWFVSSQIDHRMGACI